VRDFLSPPSPQQQACHAPKPILLNTGLIRQPYPWQPDVTEVSVMRLGNFVSEHLGFAGSGCACWEYGLLIFKRRHAGATLALGRLVYVCIAP
jgi:hypothetical protein